MPCRVSSRRCADLRGVRRQGPLLALLDQYLTGVGPRAILGSELSGEAGGEISVVLTSFQLPNGESGLVGVLGHKRMDYPHIIPIVDYIGHYLGEGGGTDVER
jgi:heat-inducible transcriptional repressor